VAEVVYAPPAQTDLERLTEFLLDSDPVAALATYDLITRAIAILAEHPLIGRPVAEEHRELIISRGRSGYLALYDVMERDDQVIILAIRHQREAGYKP
jgi:plasmid stabilization system protein ParE